MRSALLLSSVLLASLGSGCATADKLANLDPLLSVDYGEPRTVDIRNFVGRLEIRESRTFGYSDETAKLSTIDEAARTLSVNAGVPASDFRCEILEGDVLLDDPAPEGSSIRIGVEDFADGHLDSLPLIKIRGGGDTIRLVVRDSILFGEVGDIVDLDVEMTNCGRLDVGDVRGTTKLVLGGDSRVDLDDTPALTLTATGRALAEAERVGNATATLSEQSELRLADVQGLATLDLTDASVARVAMARELRVDMDDATRLYANRLTGTAKLSGAGVPRIEVERAALAELDVELSGRGEARIDGTTELARLAAHGNALVEVHEVSEAMSFDTSGSATIRVDRDAQMLARSRIQLPRIGKGTSRYGDLASTKP